MRENQESQVEDKKASNKGARAPFSSLLDRAITVLKNLGNDFAANWQNLIDIQGRLLQGRFHLAVLGQFKRGKSSLLNALLGESILPTSVVPLTMIPTFIHAGSPKRARVHFQDSDQPSKEFSSESHEELVKFLSKFVTETENPKNQLEVSQVEIFHPSYLLQEGVVLIDTPGIGSTLKHNTEATLNFLPQCDAALFLVSADPPITEVEIKFLREVMTKIPRLFFVLNKIDYLCTEDIGKALEFLRRVLKEQAGIQGDVSVFCVSAKQGLYARQNKDSEGWAKSGMANIEKHLVGFLANEKTEALYKALTLKTSDIITDTLMQMNLMINSLKMPAADMERRMKIFEEKLNEAKNEKIIVSDVLKGESRRIIESLYEEGDQIKKKARIYFESVAKERAIEDGNGFNEKTAEGTLAEAMPGFCEHEAGRFQHIFDQRVTELLKKHQQKANDLTENIRKTAAELFDVPYQPLKSPAVLPQMRQIYWTTHKWNSSLLPFSPNVFEVLLPLYMRKKRAMKRLRWQINFLVNYNIGKMRLEVQENIEKAFQTFASNLGRRFEEIISTTSGAFNAACQKRKESEENTRGEISRLQNSAAELADIQTKVKTGVRL